MTYTKTNWVANVTPVTAASMNNIESGIGQLSAATSATPPGSPVDGQLWLYPVGGGIVWQFRYNAGSASAYKWEFIGGAPIYFNAGSLTLATANVFTDIGSGPTFTLPRGGDYLVQFACQVQAVAYASPYNIDLQALAGATPGPLVTFVATAGFGGVFLNSTVVLSGRSAAEVVKIQGRIASAQSTTFSNPWLYVTPIRVS
jgi:hypothetical protein